MANDPIGLIGLGIMGKPMARNLLKAGHKLVVYDIVPQALDEIMSEGPRARVLQRSRREVRFVITMVPNRHTSRRPSSARTASPRASSRARWSSI